MKPMQKTVNFYYSSLLNGCYEGFKSTQQGTLLLQGTSQGYYIQMFDTLQQGETFHKAVLNIIHTHAKQELIVAATDSLEVFYEDALCDISTLLMQNDLSADHKSQILCALPSYIRHVNQTDVLLHQVQGRYVFIMMRMYPVQASTCELTGITLNYPKNTFTSYFPEIYQSNDFFNKYISILQTLFLQTEAMVDNVPSLLDYEKTTDANVPYLASWLGIDNRKGRYTPAQLRKIIANAHILQGAKGTKAALRDVLNLLYDVDAYIIEHFEWLSSDFSPRQQELHKALYGSSNKHFCVILQPKQGAKLPPQAQLEEIITEYSMMGAQFEIIVLKPTNYSDKHCYLDINARLSTPHTAGIGTSSVGGHIVVG